MGALGLSFRSCEVSKARITPGTDQEKKMTFLLAKAALRNSVYDEKQMELPPWIDLGTPAHLLQHSGVLSR